jgi:lysine N6-hydroxylase
MDDMKHFDLFGVGIGPFNLSIAALTRDISALNACFADAHSSMTWHPGLLLNDARMQTSPLKDMVTAVEPTNPLSFLSYLVSKKKIYAFMAAQMQTISRLEFADYLAWVASKIDNLMFDNPVEAIEFSEGKFLIHTNKGLFTSQHLCLGTGKRTYVPEFARPFIGDKCIHASTIGRHLDEGKSRSYEGKTLAIVGGGQTGADVFLNILKGQWGKPAKVIWISRRPNFQALDEGVFSDQYFTPNYGELFYGLDKDVKQREISQQKLTSDGITSSCLKDIYQHLYHETFILGRVGKWLLKPHRTLKGLAKSETGYQLTLVNGLTKKVEQCQVDEVVFCTGYESSLPAYLGPIKDKLELDEKGAFQLNHAFRVKWDGSKTNHIYAVNAGLNSHGILEPQLSLSAWRSATIINDLLGKPHFDLTQEAKLIDWGYQ